jgi:hypothetical protein
MMDSERMPGSCHGTKLYITVRWECPVARPITNLSKVTGLSKKTVKNNLLIMCVLYAAFFSISMSNLSNNPERSKIIS